MVRRLKIVTKDISSIEVGKYYLKVEFNKLFPDESLRSKIEKTVDDLDENTFWRLLEAMSFSYRLNGIFWEVSNTKYYWSEEELNAEDIRFVPMNPTIDKVSFSEEIDGNPLKFFQYLKDYFAAHPSDDTEGLNQFRLNLKRLIHYPKLFVVEKDGKLQLLDGGNRLIALLMQGQERVTAFVGRETSDKNKPRIGESTFWLLGRLYNQANVEDKEAVLKTIKLLTDNSSDGILAIKKYWLPNIKDPELLQKIKKDLKIK